MPKFWTLSHDGKLSGRRTNLFRVRTGIFYHCADNGPAYLTILIVVFLMAPTLLSVYPGWRPGSWKMLFTFGVGCLELSLYLLLRFEGAKLRSNGPKNFMVLPEWITSCTTEDADDRR